MDSESSLSLLALFLSLMAFVVVNLAEPTVRSQRVKEGASKVGHGPMHSSGEIFPPLRLLSTIVVVLSAVALTQSIVDASWAIIAGGVLPLLACLHLLRLVLAGIGVRSASSVRTVTLPVFVALEWAFRPLLRLSERWAVSAKAVANGRTVSSEPGEAKENGEELAGTPLLEEAAEADERERRMIRAVLHLEDITAREVMVPRVDIVATEATTPLAAVSDRMSEGGHSRIPIYEETIDKIVGIVHARDFLKYLDPGSASATLTLRDIARPAVFIPESKPLDELLLEFQERHVTIAVVVDEYGGTEGLITMEDLVEEIVGEIEDEFELEEPTVLRVSEHEVILDARLSLDEVNELLQTSLEGDGFDTLGGLLYSRFEKIPASGDELTLDGLRLQVLSTAGRRIRKVRILRHQ